MKKYLFSDIDVTFLQGHFLSKKRKAFEPTSELIEASQKFVIQNDLIFATGRRLSSVRKLEAKTGLEPNFAITMNGALVYDPNNEIIKQTILSKDEVKSLLTFLESEQILSKMVLFTLYMEDENVVQTYRKPQFIFRFIAKKLAGMMSHMKLTEIMNGEHDLIKIVLVGTKKQIEVARNKIENSGKQYEIFKSSAYSLEICAPGANKGAALETVMKLQYTPGRTYYIGDSENDIAGIKASDTSFAITHGDAKVKSLANHVVETVDEAMKIIENSYED